MARVALIGKKQNQNNQNKTSSFNNLLPVALIRFYDFTYSLDKY